MSDLVTLARELGLETKQYVSRMLAPLLAENADLRTKIAVLESRALVAGPIGPPGEPGAPGRDVDPAELLALKAEIATLRTELALAQKGPDVSGLVTKAVSEEVARQPKARDGKDVDVAMIQAFVDAAVTKALALLPVPKDGRDGVSVDPAVVDVMVAAQVERAVKAIPVPKDGRDGSNGTDGRDGEKGADGRDGASLTVSDVEPLVSDLVTKAVQALPLPSAGRDGARGEDGRSLTPADVEPLIVDLVTKAVAALPVPKDGAGVVDALTDRFGHLILTLSDGRTKDVGPIVGKDVTPEDVTAAVAEFATKALAEWPRPKDGADGRDGLGFDDLRFEHDDRGRLYLVFQKADVEKRVRVPGIADQKVWKPGEMYLKGDAVTYRRSLFICQRDHPTGKPEDPSGDWRLSVMRGRDAEQPRPQERD